MSGFGAQDLRDHPWLQGGVGAQGDGVELPRGSWPASHHYLSLLAPGLMVSGYAVTGAVLGQDRLINYATNGAKFLKRHMFDVASGRLMRTCYTGSGGTVEHRLGAG